jgi:hypothetical protein
MIIFPPYTINAFQPQKLGFLKGILKQLDSDFLRGLCAFAVD